jgi:hypothetical protein
MTKISYAGYRFPPVVIQQAVWLYARFTLRAPADDDQRFRLIATSHSN